MIIPPVPPVTLVEFFTRFLLPDETVEGGGILDRHLPIRWGNFRLSKSDMDGRYEMGERTLLVG